MTDFVGPFELMLNNECVRNMKYDGATVNNKRTIERAKEIILMEKNSFHSLNVSNNWNITSSNMNLLGP